MSVASFVSPFPPPIEPPLSSLSTSVDRRRAFLAKRGRSAPVSSRLSAMALLGGAAPRADENVSQSPFPRPPIDVAAWAHAAKSDDPTHPRDRLDGETTPIATTATRIQPRFRSAREGSTERARALAFRAAREDSNTSLRPCARRTFVRSEEHTSELQSP